MMMIVMMMMMMMLLLMMMSCMSGFWAWNVNEALTWPGLNLKVHPSPLLVSHYLLNFGGEIIKFSFHIIFWGGMNFYNTLITHTLSSKLWGVLLWLRVVMFVCLLNFRASYKCCVIRVNVPPHSPVTSLIYFTVIAAMFVKDEHNLQFRPKTPRIVSRHNSKMLFTMVVEEVIIPFWCISDEL